MNRMSLMNYINEKVVGVQNIPIQNTQDDSLSLVPIDYVMIRVIQNPLRNVPGITFYNGYEDYQESFNRQVNLSANDRHLIGDNERRDSTRKEYLSFVNINEVGFFQGGFIKQGQNKTKFYSGNETDDDVVLVCQDNNNPSRRLDGQVVTNSCDEIKQEECLIENCDVCDGSICQICKPGFELFGGIC